MECLLNVTCRSAKFYDVTQQHESFIRDQIMKKLRKLKKYFYLTKTFTNVPNILPKRMI